MRPVPLKLLTPATCSLIVVLSAFTASATDTWSHAQMAVGQSAVAQASGDLAQSLTLADEAFALHGDDARVAARYLSIRARLAGDYAGYAFQLVYLCQDRRTLDDEPAESLAKQACETGTRQAKLHRTRYDRQITLR
jgi:hypothetical protein